MQSLEPCPPGFTETPVSPTPQPVIASKEQQQPPQTWSTPRVRKPDHVPQAATMPYMPAANQPHHWAGYVEPGDWNSASTAARAAPYYPGMAAVSHHGQFGAHENSAISSQNRQPMGMAPSYGVPVGPPHGPGPWMWNSHGYLPYGYAVRPHIGQYAPHYVGMQHAWPQQQPRPCRDSPRHQQVGRVPHTPRTPRHHTPRKHTPRSAGGAKGTRQQWVPKGTKQVDSTTESRAAVEARLKQIEGEKKRAEEIAEQLSAQAAQLVQEKSAMAAAKQMLESERDHLIQRVHFMEQVAPLQSPELPKEQLLQEIDRLQEEMQRMQIEKQVLQRRLEGNFSEPPAAGQALDPLAYSSVDDPAAESSCSSADEGIPSFDVSSRGDSVSHSEPVGDLESCVGKRTVADSGEEVDGSTVAALCQIAEAGCTAQDVPS